MIRKGYRPRQKTGLKRDWKSISIPVSQAEEVAKIADEKNMSVGHLVSEWVEKMIEEYSRTA